MARLSKLKRSNREITKERERKRKVRKIQEERGCGESSEVEEDVTAVGLLPDQQSAGLFSDDSDESEDEDVLVSEVEELEGVDESAFGRLVASAAEQSRCVLCVPVVS